MNLRDALAAADWDAIVQVLPSIGGLPLLDAVSGVESGDVEGPSPVGLWHVAALRLNRITMDRGEPLPPEALADGASFRDALKARAQAGSVTIHRASRNLSDPGFFVVRADGAYRPLPCADEVELEGEGGARRVKLDLIDWVEAAQRPDDGPWRAPIGGDTLAARWPTEVDTVLSFATVEATEDALGVVETAFGRRPPAVALALRHTGRLLMRTLYAGDFAGAEALTEVDIVMHLHRRLWAPPG